MPLYQFRPDDARRFAIERGITTKESGKELRFKYCPYCNGGKKQEAWKFAINLETGAFNCKRGSCGATGNMLTLHKDFDFSLGSTVDGYFSNRSKRFRDLTKYPRPTPKPDAVKYMLARGISQEVTEQYGITVQSEHTNVLVFPFIDENGKMQFVKYRNAEYQSGVTKGAKEWCEKSCKPILFGMDHCDANKSETLVMTEGQIDSLSLVEAGVENAVSVPTGKNGFTWIPYCWDFLKRFKTLVVFGDLEYGEISLLDEMKSRFDGVVKHVKQEDYLGCKDANEILVKHGKYAVKNAVSSAVAVENPKIKNVMEIKRVNVGQLERFDSGIASLDKTLGGFFFGQLILLSGKRGEGKSTLASQIGVSAMSAGYPVLFYSGELMDWMLRDWLDRQIAGRRGIISNMSNNGFMSYTVDGKSEEKIEAKFHDYAWVYDNGIIDSEDEIGKEETLLETFESAIKQYGCRVIIVDNLMTAIDDDTTSDLYRQQSNFVKSLSRMAKKFNVVIILIAHPKKYNGDFENDSVSGSSNITNLVDTVMVYSRAREDNSTNADSVLRVTKNRLTGKYTPENGIPLFFEESSKRISESLDFSWETGWEQTAVNTDINAEQNLPFE